MDRETSDILFNLETEEERSTLEWAKELLVAYPRTFSGYTAEDLVREYQDRA